MKLAMALGLAFLFSCASMVGKVPTGYSLTKIENKEKPEMSGYGAVRASYTTAEENLASLEQKIKNEMLSEEKAKSLKDNAPKGGYFYVEIFRSDVETASLNMFSYIVFKNGKEVFREEANKDELPSAIVADPPHSYNTYATHWRNSDIVNIPVTFIEGDTIQLFVIDKLGGRDEFTLTKMSPEQAAKQVEAEKEASISPGKKKF